MRFQKNDKIYNWQVKNGHVMCTVLNGKSWVMNPTVQKLLDMGYEQLPDPEPQPTPDPEPYVPTIEELVEGKLRERYSINQEFEVQRKRETEPQAFQEYYDYVEWCISWANEQEHREEQESES